MEAMILPAICSKARRTPLCRRLRRRAASLDARPISSFSTRPIPRVPARGRSTRRSPESCAAAPSIRASSKG
jgi:hypothetical protein